MTLVVSPITITDALAFCDEHHSHLPPPVSGLIACSVRDGERLCVVAILGRPVARMLQAKGCAEITRVASDGTEHAASKCVAAISRAALALGWRRLVSSTILGESGTTYRAAGWRPVSISETSEGWASHPKHTSGSFNQPGRKVRWEFGPEALPRVPDVERAVREAVGTVAIPPRRISAMPLFDGGTATPEATPARDT